MLRRDGEVFFFGTAMIVSSEFEGEDLRGLPLLSQIQAARQHSRRRWCHARAGRSLRLVAVGREQSGKRRKRAGRVGGRRLDLDRGIRAAGERR